MSAPRGEHSGKEPLPVRLVNRRRWQDDAVSYGAAIVACAALVVSIWQGALSRQFNRVSVLPILFSYADFSLGPEKAGLILDNRGAGAAVLNSSFVYLVGKGKQPMTHQGWAQVLRDGGISTQTETISWALEPGFVIDAHQPLTVLRLPNGASPEHVEKLKRFVQTDLIIEICYCSLYNECRRMTYEADRTTNVAAECPLTH